MNALLLAAALVGAPQASGRTPRWTFELRLTPYHPVLSDNRINQELFEDTMFKSSLKGALFEGRPILWGIEIDHYLLTRVGLLGIGGRVGYWKVTGHTRICRDPSTGATQACSSAVDAADPTVSSRGNSEQSLSIVPLSVDAIWRVDTAWRELGVPIVPYGKVGVDWHLWTLRTNGEVSRTRNGEKARGGVLGWHAAAGVAVNIDWLEPGSRPRGTGPVGSYLFGEAQWIRGADFAQHAILDPSDFVILGGLSLDFD